MALPAFLPSFTATSLFALEKSVRGSAALGPDHARTLAPGSRILDLGAGIGRHALAQARDGHRVTALDASEAAMAAAAAAAFAEGLTVETVLAPMTDLPLVPEALTMCWPGT